jgi:hypothetical protein
LEGGTEYREVTLELPGVHDVYRQVAGGGHVVDGQVGHFTERTRRESGSGTGAVSWLHLAGADYFSFSFRLGGHNRKIAGFSNGDLLLWCKRG